MFTICQKCITIAVTFYNSEQTQRVDNVTLGPDNHMILTSIDFLNT